MKLPRGVSGDRLARALERIGYRVIRQKGSHLRLQHIDSILVEVAQMRSISIDSLMELL